MPSRLFLLSPARLDGSRAKQLTSASATFAAATQYRTAAGVEIADAFAFMSALYFRGKVAYARRFAVPSPSLDGNGIFVITSGYGLVPPDWRITEERMQHMQDIDIDADTSSYTTPLREHAQEIAHKLAAASDEAEVVLLGSIATGKYVDVLRPILGDRLRFPTAFAGLGDMARGGLMLRAAREGKELEYAKLDANRKRLPGATGKMPVL